MTADKTKPVPVLRNPDLLMTPRMIETMKYFCEQDKPEIFIVDGRKFQQGYNYIINTALEGFLKVASKDKVNGFVHVDSSLKIEEENRKRQERIDKAKADHKERLLREKANENLIQKEMARLREEEAKNEKAK